jgi:uncharacterized protein
MRIEEKSKSRSIAKREKGAAARSVPSPGAPLFAARLTKIARTNADYAGELQRLKEEIDKAGDILEQEPTIANFKIFRELLGAMARKVSSEAYKMEMLTSGFTGRTHEVITVIDKEADLLYHLVMREQKDHIRIVAKIIKIKGLVVDFVL